MQKSLYRAYPLTGLSTDAAEINTAIFAMLADYGLIGDEAENLYVLFDRSMSGRVHIFRVAQNATVSADIDRSDRRGGVVMLKLTYLKYSKRDPSHKLPWLDVRGSGKNVQAAFLFNNVQPTLH